MAARWSFFSRRQNRVSDQQTLTTQTAIEVETSHTDVLGHLNHVQAVEFFERARDDWYAASGLWGGRPFSEDEVLGTVVVNINIDYRAECFLGEKLIVHTTGDTRGTKSFTLSQQIVKPDHTVAIEARATSVVMDMQSRSTVEVPAPMQRHLRPR